MALSAEVFPVPLLEQTTGTRVTISPHICRLQGHPESREENGREADDTRMVSSSANVRARSNSTCVQIFTHSKVETVRKRSQREQPALFSGLAFCHKNVRE